MKGVNEVSASGRWTWMKWINTWFVCKEGLINRNVAQCKGGKWEDVKAALGLHDTAITTPYEKSFPQHWSKQQRWNFGHNHTVLLIALEFHLAYTHLLNFHHNQDVHRFLLHSHAIGAPYWTRLQAQSTCISQQGVGERWRTHLTGQVTRLFQVRTTACFRHNYRTFPPIYI